MGQDKRRGSPPSYEEAPPTRWVPLKRAESAPPPAPVEQPALRPPAPPPAPIGDARSPFAVDRDSPSGMLRRARHEEGGRVVAIAVIAGAALLVLAVAFALLRQ